MSRYASGTSVSITKSRAEIEKTLRRFGAVQMQWSDDFKNARTMLRFSWHHDGGNYMARFVIQVPTEDELRREPDMIHGSTGKVSEPRLQKALERRGMVEHRELALLLKAAFVAVDAGIIEAEQLFMPFLEGADGLTVSEVLLPRLPKLLGGGADRLLT